MVAGSGVSFFLNLATLFCVNDVGNGIVAAVLLTPASRL
jgi:hypothetical protein